eukprot:763288-Amphidinium_carterae.1
MAEAQVVHVKRIRKQCKATVLLTPIQAPKVASQSTQAILAIKGILFSELCMLAPSSASPYLSVEPKYQNPPQYSEKNPSH